MVARSDDHLQPGQPMRLPTFRLALLGLAFTLACGDDTGPGHPPLSFTAKLDGLAWPSDTAVAIAFGAATDTALSVAAVRSVSAAEEQQISFVLHGFSGTGSDSLGDSTFAGVGAFAISQVSGGVITATTIYRTIAAAPGTVTITRLNRADSTVSGSFAFETALSPDTAPHRQITGSFTIRLEFIPVFVGP